jgi:protein-tyrosine phosphatase
MESVYPNLYVGGDEDYLRLKDQPGWKFVRACKDGPGGHRQTVGYTTRGAPKNQEYYFAERDDRLALNLIDSLDPAFIHNQPIEAALLYINKQLKAGFKVLVACNQGISRGPSIAMMYLGMIHDLPSNFREAFRVFKVLYNRINPTQGMEFYLKHRYSQISKEQ